MATDVEILYPFICPAAPSCNYGPLVSSTKWQPGRLAFEPLCLNTCAWAGAGAVRARARAHTHTHVRGLCFGKGPPPSPGRAGQKLPWPSVPHCSGDTSGTWRPPQFPRPPRQRTTTPHSRASLASCWLSTKCCRPSIIREPDPASSFPHIPMPPAQPGAHALHLYCCWAFT